MRCDALALFSEKIRFATLQVVPALLRVLAIRIKRALAVAEKGEGGGRREQEKYYNNGDGMREEAAHHHFYHLSRLMLESRVSLSSEEQLKAKPIHYMHKIRRVLWKSGPKGSSS